MPARDARAATPAADRSWRHRDHTRGSLLGSLTVLALPLLATSVAGATYQLVDLAFVSRLGEDATTAVIVTNQSVRQLLFMLVMGASFGAQALVAHHVGAGEREAAERVVGQVVALGLVFAVVVAVMGLVAARPLLAAMNVAPSVLDVGVPYLRLVLLLSVGFVFGFLLNALLLGSGDATTPLAVSLVQTAVALGAEWCLVFGHLGLPALGVRGVALGVAVGQAAGIAVALRALRSGGTRLRLRGRHLRPRSVDVRRILGLSWPPALQMIGGFLVTVFFLRLAGDFGEDAQTAYSIGLRLSMLGPMLAFPLAGACATLVGQNLGAGRVARAWRAVGVGLAVHLAVLWSAAAVLFAFRGPILRAFSDDADVVRIGSELLVYQAGAFVAWGFYFVFLRALQGAGDVRVPMALALGNAVLLTLPLGVWLSTEPGLGMGPTGIFAASLVGAVTVTVATGAWLLTGRWTRRAAAPGAAEPRGGTAPSVDAGGEGG